MSKSSNAGSSPHTRGARENAARAAHLIGIIPAYAGSTGTLRLSYIQFRDHPRIRGEHHLQTWKGWSGNGSSPHTRGALALFACAYDRDGIIPAYAGSTPILRHPEGGCQDHPRIRGEHQLALMKPGDLVGSSPHTRGALLPHLHPGEIQRIIPAYAGSTSPAVVSYRQSWDHPRIRGEHAAPPGTILQTRGSSPHTRGARCHESYRRTFADIIPAYAGSTASPQLL